MQQLLSTINLTTFYHIKEHSSIIKDVAPYQPRQHEVSTLFKIMFLFGYYLLIDLGNRGSQ